MSTKVLVCTCQHTDQDKIYGMMKRLHNHAPCKGSKPKRYRCTVCRKEKDA